MSELRRITERYRLDKLVSAGDGGSLFRGTDIQSEETVAVKLINTENGESEENRQRFLQTCRTLQAIHHASIPRVLDFGFTTAGSAFLVTEYLHGSSFADFPGSSPARVLSLLLLLVDGLDAMAREGIFPRNLRVENLLVVPSAEGEQVKILGLGTTALTADAVPVAEDYRKDLRALGLLACQMLRLPTEAEFGIPLEVAAELEDVEALRALLDASLHGDPEGTYPSYQEVRKALRLALFGETGRKLTPRTETLTIPPKPEEQWGSGDGTVAVRKSDILQENPTPPSPFSDADTRPGIASVEPPRAGGTVILGSPWSPQPPATSSRKEDLESWNRASPDGTMLLPTVNQQREAAPPQPPPAAPADGTARIQISPELEELRTGVFVPPVPPPPEPTPEVSAQQSQGTVLIPLPPSVLDSTRATAPLPPLAAPAVLATPPELPPLPVMAEPEPRWTPPPAAPVAVPEPPPPTPTPAPIPVAEARPPAAVPPRNRRGLLLKAGVPVGVVLLAGITTLVLLRTTPEPPPPPPKPVAKPAVRPPVVPQPTAPAPAPVHSQIVLAETFLGAGDLKGMKTAIDAIPPDQQAAFRPDELERYQRLVDALTPLKREEAAGNLARALDKGDLRLLGNVVRSIGVSGEGDLPPEARSNLARARKILEIDSRLSRAQKAGNPLEVIRQADALLVELPRSSRASEQREKAASGVESQADAETEAGQFDAALNRLEELRQIWPERSGLAARIERIANERRADQGFESLLASVAQAEKANKPLEGLQLLAGARPNRRFADRFQEARQRLEAQFAELDRRSPEVVLRGSSEPVYEKGKAATISLRITDDYDVKSVEGWARAEGGQFVKLPVRRVSGSDYAMDVPPDLHDNKTVEFYATASDQSGHSGQLGSADRPLKMKRKGFFKTILGKDGG